MGKATKKALYTFNMGIIIDKVDSSPMLLVATRKFLIISATYQFTEARPVTNAIIAHIPKAPPRAATTPKNTFDPLVQRAQQ